MHIISYNTTVSNNGCISENFETDIPFVSDFTKFSFIRNLCKIKNGTKKVATIVKISKDSFKLTIQGMRHFENDTLINCLKNITSYCWHHF